MNMCPNICMRACVHAYMHICARVQGSSPNGMVWYFNGMVFPHLGLRTHFGIETLKHVVML